jgi:hypothetical protein
MAISYAPLGKIEPEVKMKAPATTGASIFNN